MVAQPALRLLITAILLLELHLSKRGHRKCTRCQTRVNMFQEPDAEISDPTQLVCATIMGFSVSPYRRYARLHNVKSLRVVMSRAGVCNFCKSTIMGNCFGHVAPSSQKQCRNRLSQLRHEVLVAITSGCLLGLDGLYMSMHTYLCTGDI